MSEPNVIEQPTALPAVACSDLLGTDKVYPFHCGTQIMDWKYNNCEKCQKGYDNKACKWMCPLEEGMDKCYMGDGSYPLDLAKQIGMPEDCTVYLWRCPAFVPNDGTQRGRDAEATNATETRTRPSLK